MSDTNVLFTIGSTSTPLLLFFLTPCFNSQQHKSTDTGRKTLKGRPKKVRCTRHEIQTIHSRSRKNGRCCAAQTHHDEAKTAAHRNDRGNQAESGGNGNRNGKSGEKGERNDGCRKKARFDLGFGCTVCNTVFEVEIKIMVVDCATTCRVDFFGDVTEKCCC